VKPPLSFNGDVIGIGESEGFRSRIRVYDYGVVSVALQRPFDGTSPELAILAQEAKLKTLDDIYGVAVEQSAMSRGQFLELTVVLILILELALILMGVMS
jgi:hypothetical protein